MERLMDVRLRDHIKTEVLNATTSRITIDVPTDSVLDLIQLLESLLNAVRFIRRSTRTTFAAGLKLSNEGTKP